ncbi:aspartyl-phosphate phosphatase Spo0E family protein [Scopulibacillus cellulosilyticus]|uniref:Aspartyl-phosphate phosphatase Spo0E family protein n=1 Tax=Scopulibacillus cellulosilyticus TaxID=2665665 RepID=A0ABW2PVR4_9BACL
MNNNEIEKKRNQLIETANRHGFTSTKTLLCSQELDRLLDEYQHKTLALQTKTAQSM